MVVVAKKDIPQRTKRAKELYNMAPVRKKWIEYDDEHYLDPAKIQQGHPGMAK